MTDAFVVNSFYFLVITTFFSMLNNLPEFFQRFSLDSLFLSLKVQIISLFRKSKYMIISGVQAPLLISVTPQRMINSVCVSCTLWNRIYLGLEI